MDPAHTPDGLEPQRGGRRVTRVPLYVALGLAALMAGAIDYTDHDRLERQRAEAGRKARAPDPAEPPPPLRGASGLAGRRGSDTGTGRGRSAAPGLGAPRRGVGAGRGGAPPDVGRGAGGGNHGAGGKGRGRARGADQGGYGGLTDRVNNHVGRVIGNALLLSVFSAGVRLSQPQPRGGSAYDSHQITAGALGQQPGRFGSEYARRGLDETPTLEVRPGYRFTVMMTKDIVLPSWKG